MNDAIFYNSPSYLAHSDHAHSPSHIDFVPKMGETMKRDIRMGIIMKSEGNRRLHTPSLYLVTRYSAMVNKGM